MARVISEEALAVVTIWQEARGEPYAGKVAVAEVIRNRMRARYSSDGTVAGTVARAYQFSGWNAQDPGRVPSLRLDDADAVVLECARAWRDAQAGSETVGGAVLYHAQYLAPPSWAAAGRAVRIAQVGRHIFYRAL